PRRVPQAVRKLHGAPTAVIYEREPSHETLVPDRFGEVHVSFSAPRLGLGYGVCWKELPTARPRTGRARSRPGIAQFVTSQADGFPVSLAVPRRDRPGQTVKGGDRHAASRALFHSHAARLAGRKRR